MARKAKNAGSTALKMLKGALAGVAGVWALDRVTWLLWNRQDKKSLQREQKVRPGGLDPAHVIAAKLADLADLELSPRQPNPMGVAAHYALGVLPAAVYAATRRKKGMDWKRGVALGAGMFIAHDELANWALGLSGPPTAYPWQAHARGLAGHLVFGTATEGALTALDRLSRDKGPKREQMKHYTRNLSGVSDYSELRDLRFS